METGGNYSGNLVAKASRRCIDFAHHNATLVIQSGLCDCHRGQNRIVIQTASLQLPPGYRLPRRGKKGWLPRRSRPTTPGNGNRSDTLRPMQDETAPERSQI
jgi:hypothetical protein